MLHVAEFEWPLKCMWGGGGEAEVAMGLIVLGALVF